MTSGKQGAKSKQQRAGKARRLSRGRIRSQKSEVGGQPKGQPAVGQFNELEQPIALITNYVEFS